MNPSSLYGMLTTILLPVLLQKSMCAADETAASFCVLHMLEYCMHCTIQQ